MGPEQIENLDEFQFAAERKIVRLDHDVEIGLEIIDLEINETKRRFEIEDKRTE